MSAIQKELIEETGLKPKRGQDRQEFLAALMVKISDLTDEGWDALSSEAQAWYNKAADAKNAKKKEMPDFPDLEEEEEKAEEKPARRKGKVEEERLTKVGDTATVLTKRGKSVTGEVVEISEKLIVIKDDEGEETEFMMDRVESVTVAHGEAGADDEDDGPETPDFKVGDQVIVETLRGKVIEGELIELTDSDVVVIAKGEKAEQEFSRDRIKSIVPVKAKAAAKEEKASTRRASSKEEKEEPATKSTRVSNGDVSIGTRIKEMIADDPEATEAEIAKLLTKEGLAFKDATLKLNYVDCHKFIKILKDKKRLK